MINLSFDEGLYWSHVDFGIECWEWLGYRRPEGYGRFRIRSPRAMVHAHRVSFYLAKGYLPGRGRSLDHLCRNRACVRPDHLEDVAVGENTLRGNGPPAVNKRRATCIKGHPLSGENLCVDMRTGYRQCRVCRNARSRRRYANSHHT